MAKKTEFLGFRATPEFAARARAAAAKRRLTISELLRLLIERELARGNRAGLVGRE